MPLSRNRHLGLVCVSFSGVIKTVVWISIEIFLLHCEDEEDHKDELEDLKDVNVEEPGRLLRLLLGVGERTLGHELKHQGFQHLVFL